MKRTLKEKASTSNDKRNDARCNSDKYNSQPLSEGGAGHPLVRISYRITLNIMRVHSLKECPMSS